MTPANVTCRGGSPAVAQAILAAHASAVQTLTIGQGAAAQGIGSLATWFGAASANPDARVAAALGHGVAFLNDMWFVYGLDATLPHPLAPDVYVTFGVPSGGLVEAAVWEQIPSFVVLDAQRAGWMLTISIAHEALITCEADVEDLAGVQSSQDASLLASVSPTAALRSARSYTEYLQQYVPTAQAVSPTPGSRKAGSDVR
jgi:hypothetical protein